MKPEEQELLSKARSYLLTGKPWLLSFLECQGVSFNPILDDGQCLRLMRDNRIVVRWEYDNTWISFYGRRKFVKHSDYNTAAVMCYVKMKEWYEQ